MIIKESDLKRFWAKVNRTAGCWLWTASLSRENGYGILGRPGGRVNGKTKLIMAHRFSWEVAFGPVPDGLGVLHRCDVPQCVRPEHLFVGTQKVNMQDAAAKGRLGKGKGERAPLAKLTAADVIDIRTLRAFGATTRALADAFEMHTTTIQRVVAGRYWSHV